VFRVVEGLVVRLELVGFTDLSIRSCTKLMFREGLRGDGHTLLARHADAFHGDRTLAIG
jgi:hypothetical protein